MSDGAATTWTSRDGLATLHCGHVLDVLAGMPAAWFHCCVTSPPYWELRDYAIPPVKWADGSESSYGLEKTIELYVAHTVGIFAAIWRVMRDDGVVWLNIGDSFSTSGGDGTPGGSSQRADRSYQQKNHRNRPTDGLKSGDQCLIPHRVALALQDSGWWIRQTIVWHKRSPMPESIAAWRWTRCKIKTANGACNRMTERTVSGFDYREAELAQWSPCPGCPRCIPHGGYVLRKGRWRCTNAWEPIFQLAKSPTYFCDGVAVAEKSENAVPPRGSDRKHAEAGANGTVRRSISMLPSVDAVEKRNPRNVLTFSTEPLKAKHFAAFPSSLPRFCIKASTSDAGCCPTCGSQWAPIVEKERVPTRPALNPKDRKADDADDLTVRSDISPNRDPQRHIQRTKVLGYKATCDCGHAETVPARVLEPFAGSGTTLMVARWLGRQSVGVELSQKYIDEIAKERIERPKPEKRTKAARPVSRLQKELF